MTAPLWQSGDADGVGVSESAWGDFLAKGIWETRFTCSRQACGRDPFSSSHAIRGALRLESGALRRAFEDHALRYGVDPTDAPALLGYEARGRKSLVPHYEPPVREGG